MPAETHQLRDRVDVAAVLALVASMVGLDGESGGAPDAGAVALADVGLDDDLGILELWDAVVDELGERALGDLDLEDDRPETLGELAALFHASLGG